MTASPGPHPPTPRAALQAGVSEAAHLLPGQRPIESFVHHNTLHAFEHLPFRDAVQAAGAQLGAEAFMGLPAFREAHAAGRVLERDLQHVLARHVPDEPAGIGVPGTPLRALVQTWMLHLPPPPRPAELRWRLGKRGLVRTLAEGTPRLAQERYGDEGGPAVVLPALWLAAQVSASATAAPEPVGVRPRDRAVARGLADPDRLVHPVLIRWCAAYLDHGQSYWPMPNRDRGFLAVMLQALADGAAGGGFVGEGRGAARRWLAEGADAERVSLDCLREMGVRGADIAAVVLRSALALPGWAGMFVQLEDRPDLAPGEKPPTDLAEYLAVRLVLDRAALRAVSRSPGGAGAPGPRSSAAAPELARAWARFHGAQLAGALGPEIARGAPGGERLDTLLQRYDAPTLQWLWQLAYERRYRVWILDALLNHAGAARPAVAPRAQVVTCIDDREESLRRHLEELSPQWETFGAAGSYGIGMRYRGLGEAHSVPLCAAGVVPRHFVEERPVDEAGWAAERRARRWTGRVGEAVSVGGGTLLRGSALSVAGVASLVPMVLGTVAPRLHAHMRRRGRAVATRLVLEHDPAHPTHGGLQVGFTVDEMVGIVDGILRGMGLLDRFAPLVLLLGHGSRSMNNPHEAAHDCGACGGGRGGPNARAFAAMANRPDVRAALRGRGIEIPEGTWFVGGYHNTADDAVDWYDTDAVPAHLHDVLGRLRADLEEARRRDAHERCRRFESAPLEMSVDEALRHVEERAEDLAQPRPEYGHATNALCFIGRRAWSRGLFLDRRVFLTSYEPGTDPEGRVLEGLLASLGPVGAGINLEYYFSFVDPDRYGSSTKLPHNITGLVGVMDGHASDLRTGLPWQMVEIHEPVRLLNVVEATPDQLVAILERQPGLRRLVENRWILIAAFDPGAGRIWFLEPEGFVSHEVESTRLPRVDASAGWYAGHRGHLRPASIVAGAPGAPLREVG